MPDPLPSDVSTIFGIAATSWHHIVAYTIFLIYGLVYLGSWNTWITATGFFKSRFYGSAFADTFMSYFAITYMVIMFACLALFLAMPNVIPLNRRMITGNSLVVVIFGVAAIMALMQLNPYLYFFLTLALIVLSALATSFLAALYGILPLYPPVFASAFMSGQGLAGLIPSLVQLVLTASSKDAEKDSYRAFAYFCLTILLAIFVIAGTEILLPRLHVKKENIFTEARIPDDGHLDTPGESNHDENSRCSSYRALRRTKIVLTEDSIYTAVLRRVWLSGLSLWLGFVITLASFPAITSAVASENPNDTLIVPIHFVIFNLFDLLGKTLPGIPTFFIQSPAILFIMSVARLVFPPAFLLCNVTFQDRFGIVLDRTMPLVFGKDWMFHGILALFAFSNGYIDACIVMLAPDLIPDNNVTDNGCLGRSSSVVTGDSGNEGPASVPSQQSDGGIAYTASSSSIGPNYEPVLDADGLSQPNHHVKRQRELAGAMMVAAISFGLLCGSGMSFVLRWMLCGCNPFYS
ncbi:hypothetical protein SeMB42_g02034 [Synchytrium endobioticum]|uniref:Uncharacterized protein n=1 Tax=Synchytrium endobioticum TaxID=286115 RepID=A0A507DH61_9FUNG|nr:hypothetical protein SeLEV6574_g05796 [Synchytrium endobioticum]TPX51029.1 hypothetical protein SeMB42_g02034 [Synchytrium endobioticum]